MEYAIGSLLLWDVEAQSLPRWEGRKVPGNPAAHGGVCGAVTPSSSAHMWLQHDRDKDRASQNPPYFQHQPFGGLNHRELHRADNQIYRRSSSVSETQQIPFNPFLKLFLTSAYNRVYLSALGLILVPRCVFFANKAGAVLLSN